MKKNSTALAWAHHEKRSDYVNEKLKESGLDIPSGYLESFIEKATAKVGSPFHYEKVGVAIDDTTWGMGKASEKPKSTNEKLWKLDKKPSPLDYVIEMESTEMPSILSRSGESDGGE